MHVCPLHSHVYIFFDRDTKSFLWNFADHFLFLSSNQYYRFQLILVIPHYNLPSNVVSTYLHYIPVVHEIIWNNITLIATMILMSYFRIYVWMSVVNFFLFTRCGNMVLLISHCPSSNLVACICTQQILSNLVVALAQGIALMIVFGVYTDALDYVVVAAAGSVTFIGLVMLILTPMETKPEQVLNPLISLVDMLRMNTFVMTVICSMKFSQLISSCNSINIQKERIFFFII